jgi:tetratricopeptide (TPR) repeat protein
MMKIDKRVYIGGGIVVGAVLIVLIGGKLALNALGVKNIDSLKARMALNKGVTAFSAANYQTAARHFEEAAGFDPELSDARVYLAYSTMMQYQPGFDYPENVAIAEKALNGFKDVLTDDPGNSTALQSIASLYFQMKKMDDAKQWHQKVLDVVPDYKESHYTIGVICWTQSYEPRLQFRAEIGMQQEDPGPIRTRGRLNRSQREALTEVAGEVVPFIDEGLGALEKAIEIDPDYDDAMAYVNLLYRERADFAENNDDYDNLLAQADEWVQRALDTRKRKAEESTVETFTTDE